MRRVLVFLRLVDEGSPTELSLTNLTVLFSLAIVGYSVFRSGTLDITALVALVGALGLYDQKKRRGAKKDKLSTRVEALEAKLSKVDLEKMNTQITAVANRTIGR